MNLEKTIGVAQGHDYIPLDIIYGTVIAYAIHKDDKNIQNPVCRILMKPFVNEEYPEIVYFGIEDRVYGTEVPGFVDTVSKWVDEVNNKNELSEVVILDLHSSLYNDDIELMNIAGAEPEEEKRLYRLHDEPSAIRNIEDPTEAEQLMAVKSLAHALRHIENPTDKVKIAAIKKDPSAIRYIGNPPEELQLLAVSRDGFAIANIDNPSENVQLAAVGKDAHAVKYINNPSEKVQIAAVNKMDMRYLK